MKKRIAGKVMRILVTMVMLGLAIGALLPGEGLSPLYAAGYSEAKLTASDATVGDNFGNSVAISGDTAVIGAYLANDGGGESGSAYVFVRNGTTWSLQAKLTASDATAGDWFGSSVTISGDTAIIGAYMDDDSGYNSGSAYVFVRNGTTWSQQAKLTAGDAAENGCFGCSVSTSGDTAIIGALWDDDGGVDSGSAYVFVRSGTTWSQQAKLTASDAASYDYFGYSVAISGDTAIIGALWDDDGGGESGSAYVFVRNGTTWSLQAKLTASDATAGDWFGSSVTISGDTAIIGAYMDDDSGFGSGSAYVFVRSGTTWSQQAKLTASDAAENSCFGCSVSTSGDTAVIGAYGDGSDYLGSAYIFVRSGTSWSQQAKLAASDAAAGDYFGNSVAISGDTTVIGACLDDDDGFNSGSAYVYTYTPPPGSGTIICTVEGELLSVMVTPGGVPYGTLATSAIKNSAKYDASNNPNGMTSPQTQTILNNGSMTANFQIKTSNALHGPGPTDWTLAETQGTNQFTHAYNFGTSVYNGSGAISFTKWTAPNSYVTAATGVLPTSSRYLELEIGMPTETGDYLPHTITVTVLAVAP